MYSYGDYSNNAATGAFQFSDSAPSDADLFGVELFNPQHVLSLAPQYDSSRFQELCSLTSQYRVLASLSGYADQSKTAQDNNDGSGARSDANEGEPNLDTYLQKAQHFWYENGVDVDGNEDDGLKRTKKALEQKRASDRALHDGVGGDSSGNIFSSQGTNDRSDRNQFASLGVTTDSGVPRVLYSSRVLAFHASCGTDAGEPFAWSRRNEVIRLLNAEAQERAVIHIDEIEQHKIARTNWKAELKRTKQAEREKRRQERQRRKEEAAKARAAAKAAREAAREAAKARAAAAAAAAAEEAAAEANESDEDEEGTEKTDGSKKPKKVANTDEEDPFGWDDDDSVKVPKKVQPIQLETDLEDDDLDIDVEDEEDADDGLDVSDDEDADEDLDNEDDEDAENNEMYAQLQRIATGQETERVPRPDIHYPEPAQWKAVGVDGGILTPEEAATFMHASLPSTFAFLRDHGLEGITFECGQTETAPGVGSVHCLATRDHLFFTLAPDQDSSSSGDGNVALQNHKRLTEANTYENYNPYRDEREKVGAVLQSSSVHGGGVLLVVPLTVDDSPSEQDPYGTSLYGPSTKSTKGKLLDEPYDRFTNRAKPQSVLFRRLASSSSFNSYYSSTNGALLVSFEFAVASKKRQTLSISCVIGLPSSEEQGSATPPPVYAEWMERRITEHWIQEGAVDATANTKNGNAKSESRSANEKAVRSKEVPLFSFPRSILPPTGKSGGGGGRQVAPRELEYDATHNRMVHPNQLQMEKQLVQQLTEQFYKDHAMESPKMQFLRECKEQLIEQEKMERAAIVESAYVAYSKKKGTAPSNTSTASKAAPLNFHFVHEHILPLLSLHDKQYQRILRQESAEWLHLKEAATTGRLQLEKYERNERMYRHFSFERRVRLMQILCSLEVIALQEESARKQIVEEWQNVCVNRILLEHLLPLKERIAAESARQDTIAEIMASRTHVVSMIEGSASRGGSTNRYRPEGTPSSPRNKPAETLTITHHPNGEETVASHSLLIRALQYSTNPSPGGAPYMTPKLKQPNPAHARQSVNGMVHTPTRLVESGATSPMASRGPGQTSVADANVLARREKSKSLSTPQRSTISSKAV